jgi:hypothetical protein
MTRISTHVIAFSLGVLALGAFNQGAIPETPAWVNDYCADSSPCTNAATETYQGIALAIQWLETDGTPCPDPEGGEHPQSACLTAPPSIAHWFLLTRGGPAHYPPNAIDHDVFVATNSPIYSDGFGSGFGGRDYALGAVMAFGLPPETIPQNPQFPTYAPADTQAWFALACAADPTCGAGSLTQAEFDVLLAASPYGPHVHDLDPADITVGGQTVTTSIAR